MQAIWNVQETANMSREQNLRNLCRQLEQEYIDWHRSMTYKGYRIKRVWPAIGELDNLLGKKDVVHFITTKKRSIQVCDITGTSYGEVRALPGMAEELYILAGMIEDNRI